MSTIRKDSKDSIKSFIKSIGFLLLIFFLIVSFINLIKGSFLSYSKKEYYTPNLIKDLGFDGRTNKLLRELLLDTVAGPYTLETINEHFNSLKFEYNVDSSNDFIRADDIKIVKIICKNPNDKNFYYNSYLHELIEKQNKFNSENYFKIDIDKSNGFRIKSITIIPELYKLKLSMLDEKDDVSFENPFDKIDNNCAFFCSTNLTLPIFSSPPNSNWLDNAVGIVVKQNGIYSYFLQPFNKATPFNLSDSLLNLFFYAKKELRPISFKPGSAKEEIRIYNYNGKALELHIHDFNWIKVFDKSKAEFVNLDQKKYKHIFSYDKLPLKFIYKTTDGVINEFYLKNKLGKNNEKSTLNGKSLFSCADLFTIQFAKSINSLNENLDSVKNRICCLNPLLGYYLGDELKKYVIALQNKFKLTNDIIEASVAIVDINNGEIQAAPFYSSEFENTSIPIENFKNFNLNKHFIGSTFKPLLANAVSNLFPVLGDFSLTSEMINYRSPTSILGYPLLRPPVKDSTLWTTCESMSSFLSRSHDIYPIALTMLALTKNGLPVNNLYKSGQNNSKFFVYKNDTYIQDLNLSPLVIGITKMYGIPDDNIAYSIDNKYEMLYDSVFLKMPLKKIPSLILPEYTSLNSVLFGNAKTADSSRNNLRFYNFSSWVLGQGANEWTNIHLCQAYARLFTKKEVVCSFWKQNTIFNKCKGNRVAWEKFLMNFKKANDDKNFNLLWTAKNNFEKGVLSAKNVLGSLPELCIVGKTGTPDNFNRKESIYINHLGQKKWIDEGLYACGIMSKYNQFKTKGLTIVVHIRRLSKIKPEKGNDFNSGIARDFLSSNVFKNIIFYNQNAF